MSIPAGFSDALWRGALCTLAGLVSSWAGSPCSAGCRLGPAQCHKQLYDADTIKEEHQSSTIPGI